MLFLQTHRPFLLLVLLLAGLTTLFSCKKNPAGPEPPPPSPDTTSHFFSWSVTYIGDVSTFLYDVAIISDTLAYAVGDIHGWDSLRNGYDANVVR